MRIQPLFSSAGKIPAAPMKDTGKATASVILEAPKNEITNDEHQFNPKSLASPIRPLATTEAKSLAKKQVHFHEDSFDEILHDGKTLHISRKAHSDMKLAQGEVSFYLTRLRKQLNAWFPYKPVGTTRKLIRETLAFYYAPKAVSRRRNFDAYLSDLMKGFAPTQPEISRTGLKARIKTLDTHLKGTHHLVSKIRKSQGWFPRVSDQQLKNLQQSLKRYEQALQELLPATTTTHASIR